MHWMGKLIGFAEPDRMVNIFCEVPKDIEFMTELPKSAVGKILRRKLREMDRRMRGKSSSS